jgi:hypothetical protein
MHVWRKQILALILTLSLLALACNAITGRSLTTPAPLPMSPTPITAVITNTPAVEAGEPSPTLTLVPPQTTTPTTGTADPDPTTDGGSSLTWPEPVSLPVPFADTAVSAAQQTTFDTLSQARQPERNDIELAQLYQGFTGPLPVPPTGAAPLTVGTTQLLNVLNHEENTLSAIEVEVLVVSDHAYFWFDTGPGTSRPSEAA